MSLTANLSALPAPVTGLCDLADAVALVSGVDGQLMARRIWSSYDLLAVYRSDTRWDVGGWTGVPRLPQLATFFYHPKSGLA